ncbi:hypothetical protein ACEWY4_013776 [Coilia grayii]|uniref:Uncharacterized protein n=1 Tax=Coilia grayii TaxID=363190 RepID=A0ABD1JXA0_9TELE
MLSGERMCGKGMVCQWGLHNRQTSKDEIKADSRKDKPCWYKCGKQQGSRGKRGRAHGYLEPRRLNRWRARPSGTVLRPVNIKGNRAPGMRAPRNTNQFLMHEKYQMMHMRSDSVGTDSGSDCEMDFADMDSYLGVLENARGALLDSLELSPPPLALFCPQQLAKCEAFAFDFAVRDQEESLQYYPSEDDVNQTEDFMQRDFNEFCNTIAPPE